MRLYDRVLGALLASVVVFFVGHVLLTLAFSPHRVVWWDEVRYDLTMGLLIGAGVCIYRYILDRLKPPPNAPDGSPITTVSKDTPRQSET